MSFLLVIVLSELLKKKSIGKVLILPKDFLINQDKFAKNARFEKFLGADEYVNNFQT